MTRKTFRLVISLFLALVLSFGGFTPALAAPPANDNLANAEIITSLPFSATVDNTDATNEPNEPSACSFSSSSVWYSFTATQNVAFRVDMTGGTVFSSMSIYLASGSTISDLTLQACSYSPNPTNFPVEAGKTYYLQVGSGLGQTGIIPVNLTQISPPSNDNFDNAEIITSLPFSTTIDNTNATIEPGEPEQCGFPYQSIWYSFTPAQNMTIRVDMTGSAVPSEMNIYYLTSGPTISDLDVVTCLNAFPTDFQVEAGTTYYLQVDSQFSLAGDVQIDLAQISPSTTEVTIDIKPGRFPNRIKLRRNVCRDDDNVYVAILTTPTFNARTVDVSTLQLGDPNLSGKATPIRSRITDVDRDGDQDMGLTFTLCSIVTNGALNLSSTEMVLTGRTLDGVNFTGRDSVKVVR